MADEKDAGTKPAKVQPETGIAMHGDYPYNRRLRAESMAKAGRKSDPDGLIEPAHIEDAAARLKREAAADKKADASDEPTPAKTAK